MTPERITQLRKTLEGRHGLLDFTGALTVDDATRLLDLAERAQTGMVDLADLLHGWFSISSAIQDVSMSLPNQLGPRVDNLLAMSKDYQAQVQAVLAKGVKR